MRHHDESPRTADNPPVEVAFESRRRSAPHGVVACVLDRQCVDHDTLRHGVVAGEGNAAAIAVRPVSRYVDDPAPALEPVGGELPPCEVDEARYRGGRHAHQGRRGEAGKKGLRAVAVLDHLPIDHLVLMFGAGPFHVGKRDTP